MARLPQPGGDDGTWGRILNDFLAQAHNPDGSLKQLDQSQVKDLVSGLAAKLDTTDAALVATSGDYNDLANKPVIPDASTLVASADLDTKAAALVTNTGSSTNASLRAAFDARYAPLSSAIPGRRLAALGDSITAGIVGQATPQVDNVLQGSYLMYGLMASHGRLEWGGQFGVPGDTTAMILARVNQVIAAKPDICIVLGGTNDGALGTMKTNLPQIYNALLAAGIEPVVATLPPSSSSNALTNGPHNFIRIANAWLAEYATHHGLRLIDFFGALVDPTTGHYLSGHNSDITHPNQSGYRLMGQAVADALSGQVKAGTSWLTQDIGEATVISGGDGGLFTTGTTLPAGPWNQIGTAGTFITDSFFFGRGYQIVRANSDATTRGIVSYLGTANWLFQVGDLVSLSCKIKTSGLEASGGVTSVGVGCTGSTGPQNLVAWQVGADFPDGGVVYYEGIIPAGTTSIVVSIRVDGGNGAGDSVTVGQFGVRNLSRLASYP